MDVVDDASSPTASHRRAFELDDTVTAKAIEQIKRFRPRQQHGMTEVPACLLIGQNRGDKQALIDFDTTAIALEASRFDRQFLLARHQARDNVRSGQDELLDSSMARTIAGERAIEALNVIAQELRSGPARRFDNLCGGRLLSFVAVVGIREQTDQVS
jgi:hypothetical protein